MNLARLLLAVTVPALLASVPASARADSSLIVPAPSDIADIEPAMTDVARFDLKQLSVVQPTLIDADVTGGSAETAKGTNLPTLESPTSDVLERKPYRYSNFKEHTRSVGWEILAVTAAMSATRFSDVTKGGSSFFVKKEGFFGRKTESLGMDKFHHAWKTYVYADILQSLIENRGGDKRGAAYSGAILSLGLLTYGELLDGFTRRTGYSHEDMVAHFAGAGLSLLRNTIPGLRNKVDFRMEWHPTSGNGSDRRLVNQLSQRKFLFATQLSGFRKLENSPLRFAELHMGYYGRGFTKSERARGEPLRRKIYFGIGLNLQQLFSRNPSSRVERYAKGALDYIQLPYTSIHN